MPVACASVFMAVLLVPPAGRGEGGSAGGASQGRANYKAGVSCNYEREEKAKFQWQNAGLRRAAPHFRGLYGPGSKNAWIWGGQGRRCRPLVAYSPSASATNGGATSTPWCRCAV